MAPTSGLQSYVIHEVTRKLAFCFALCFLAVKVEPSTPSLASSVTVQTCSAVSSSAVSPTQTSLLPSSTVIPSLPQNASFQISIQLTQIAWSEDLFNKQSSRFVALAINLTTAVTNVLKTVGDASSEVVEFKPGSTIAVLKVTALSSKENDMKDKLEDEMKNGMIGSFAVDPNLYFGTLFDVVLKVKFACNDSIADKGFDQKDFENAISSVMSSNSKFIAADMQLVECLEAENITMVTARVQLNDPSTVNPKTELSGLKTAVDAGQVGNFSVIPEWKAYIPGEKLFHVLATLKTGSSDITQTRIYLEKLIKDKFKADGNLRYVNVDMPDNKTVAIDIGMSSSASELPSTTLSPLDSDLTASKLGNIKLIKKTIRVTIDPKSLTTKIFEVNFPRNVPSCQKADIANNNSLHYRNLSEGIWEFIDSSIRANQRIKPLYLETKVTNLFCHNDTTIRSISYVYMKPSTEDKMGQLQFLLKCKIEPGIYDWGLKVILKTPTLSDTKGSWNSIQGVWVHWVCPKPKPPTPPPTSLSSTTVPPTASTTTGSPTSTTEKSSTEPPHNGTEPPATSRSTKPPTSKATLPTSDSKLELYVKLKLGMTWGEFCSKQETLKERIALNLKDENGTRVSPDRIIYVNVEKNCADPNKKDELAEVWFYISQPDSKEVHKCLTLKAFRMFEMFFENGNTKPMGPDFEEKLVQVELAGNSASNYEKKNDSKMPSLTIILIAVAGAVGLFLMLLACCCLFCCRGRRRRRSKNYETEHPQTLQVIHVDGGNLAPAGTNTKGNKDKNAKNGACGNVNGDNKKGGRSNDGYEALNDNGNNNNTDTNKNINGPDNCPDRENKYTTGKPTNDDHSNKYGDLKTDAIGDHTYASINKPVSGNESSGNIITNATNVPVVVPPVQAVFGGSGGSVDGKNKGDGSSGVKPSENSSGQSQNSGSQSTPVSLRKADADPKNQERRGSYVPSPAYENVPLTHKTGTVGIVALAIRNKNENKKETEFKNLNKDVPSEEVRYPPETSGKNRFPDVLPAPSTRVKLSTQPDYINANWIRDHKGKRCYIATQHPLQETVDDFWRMVWDQQADTVVMVNDQEKEKPADFMDYLPKGEGHSKRFGAVEVTIKRTTEKADYILTVLSITENKNTASPREVSHFRFTAWKERAVPNVALFVGFVTATREARKKYGDTKAPTIVHCSDGLGFTGVYIAVDIGIKSHEESKTSVVDVFELSKNLRHDRHGIVCSLEHYNFIYQALYEYTVNYDKSNE